MLGDGVNIAARVEALAEPGGICITDTVMRQLAGKTDFGFEDAGERTLKNISQPVRVYRCACNPRRRFKAANPCRRSPHCRTERRSPCSRSRI